MNLITIMKIDEKLIWDWLSVNGPEHLLILLNEALELEYMDAIG